MTENRAKDWLAQAENDLLFAKAALKGHFYSQCCFICQQAAVKALKSIAFRKGAKVILTHSLLRLCEELRINGELKQSAGILDQYYLSGRYPDALPAGAPFEAFSEQQAEEAIKRATGFIVTARKAGK